MISINYKISQNRVCVCENISYIWSRSSCKKFSYDGFSSDSSSTLCNVFDQAGPVTNIETRRTSRCEVVFKWCEVWNLTNPMAMNIWDCGGHLRWRNLQINDTLPKKLTLHHHCQVFGIARRSYHEVMTPPSLPSPRNDAFETRPLGFTLSR